MKMGMTRREPGQFREDRITVPLVKVLGLKVEGAQPRTNAATFKSNFLTCEEQPLSKSLATLFRRYPQSVDHEPRPHRGTIKASDYRVVGVAQRERYRLPITRAEFFGVRLPYAFADSGWQSVPISCCIKLVVHSL